MRQSWDVPLQQTEPVLIRARRALVGDELEVVEPANVLVENGIIRAIGSTESGGARRIELEHVTLLPGFIDAHVHMGFARPQDVLFGGVTTVRDLAWPVDEIFPLVSRSRAAGFRGPLVIAAGQMLTVPNGYPTRAGWAPPGTGRVLRTPEEAIVAVDDMAERGACVIKVALNAQVGTSLSVDMLRAVVERAHERGLGVTAHIYGLNELEKALDAGVDEMAHMLMSPEEIPESMIERMVGSDMTVVPTLAIRADEHLEIALSNLARFADAGGRVVYGTDLGNEGPRPGIDRLEVTAMMRAGFDGRAIVASATTVAAGYLGLEDRGVIEPSKVADLIAVEGDPLDDPLSLVKICFVMRGGHIYVNKAAPAGTPA